MIEGSLATVKRTCGKPNCRCARGQKHQAVILCGKQAGRSRATYIPVELLEKVREWNQEHKRIKRVLKELSGINGQIIRQYVKDKRKAQRLRQSLKVVRPDRQQTKG